jgi:WD40 repeat protein
VEPSGPIRPSSHGPPQRARAAAGGGAGHRNRHRPVLLWNVADPAYLSLLSAVPTGGSAPVNSVAFSPDGHTLAGGDGDGTVRLWDVTDPADPNPLGQPLTGTGAAVDSVAISADGHTLASGSDDGIIRLWNLNVQYAIDRICAAAGGLTPQQWNEYIPQLRYQPSCVQ